MPPRHRLATVAAITAAVLGATAPHAAAFCGFYVGGADATLFNNATQVVLMRHGTTTVLSMVNNYQGPPEGFALVVPVPVVVKAQQVKTLDRAVFDKVDTLGAPRLVEYWERDPCQVDDRDDDAVAPVMPNDLASDEDPQRAAGADHVKIEAQFTVAEYDVVVLSATESTGLARWLVANHYQIPAGAEPLLRPYVEAGTKFFVAKVDPRKVTFVDGMATLSPLRVTYDSPDFALPIRLGLANSGGTQDLIVNILAPGGVRYEVANYPNATIPTNLVVKPDVRGRFAEFYAALFDHALALAPGAVVTEYAWDASSCDPCPGPTLASDDLATLGADALTATYQDVALSGFTLTRLHARYGAEVADDLVFRAVEPLTGGRGIPAADGALDTDVARGWTNAFQGRYVMLHPWTGAVACAAPVPGRWGGPPAGAEIAAPVAARDTAFAPRGQVELDDLVASPVPALAPLASNGQRLPIPIRKASGCACDASTSSVPTAGGLAALTLGVVLRRRRRARRA
ncbi:MAG: DUF2330 domain-containing protein [Kofleriaceae bacterium]